MTSNPKKLRDRSAFVTPVNYLENMTIDALKTALDSHQAYRLKTLNLIASENVMSPSVESFVKLELSHRYGDYSGTDPLSRKYTGNKYLGDIDSMAQDAFKSLFGSRFADLRPLSGHVAGVAPLMALCDPGDTVLELDQLGGGHRLAQKLTEANLCKLRVLPLPVDAATYNIDVPSAIEQIERERPKLVVLGSSLFLFPHPVAPLAEAVHRVGGYLQFDASHVLGLIAGGAHSNPLDDGADVITSSTHKTFAGPQGGLLLTNSLSLYDKIAPTIYPALVTNHHLHRIPALIAACEEWKAFGAAHATAVVENAQALGKALSLAGFDVVGSDRGYTQSHTVLVADSNAKDSSRRLEAANILVSAVGLPSELGGGAMRLGVQEITRRGMMSSDATEIATLFESVLLDEEDTEDDAAKVAPRVAELVRPWTHCRYTWGDN